jgi:lactoylglutathione lyase
VSEPRPRLIGMNHVALEVGDVEEALRFYGALFHFELRGRAGSMAFVDMGDQFIALSEGREQGQDDHRHFGLVVDDLEAARAALEREGVQTLETSGLEFRDPWGNRVQLVDYRDVQFARTPEVLRALQREGLEKRPEATEEMRKEGLLP